MKAAASGAPRGGLHGAASAGPLQTASGALHGGTRSGAPGRPPGGSTHVMRWYLSQVLTDTSNPCLCTSPPSLHGSFSCCITSSHGAGLNSCRRTIWCGGLRTTFPSLSISNLIMSEVGLLFQAKIRNIMNVQNLFIYILFIGKKII